jgi:hypothetical protein
LIKIDFDKKFCDAGLKSSLGCHTKVEVFFRLFPICSLNFFTKSRQIYRITIFWLKGSRYSTLQFFGGCVYEERACWISEWDIFCAITRRTVDVDIRMCRCLIDWEKRWVCYNISSIRYTLGQSFMRALLSRTMSYWTHPLVYECT